MPNEIEENIESAPVVTSVECKGCNKGFQSNSILKHLNQTKKNCLSHYSEEDINFLKEQSKKLSNHKERLWKYKNLDSKVAEHSAKYYHANKVQICKKRAISHSKKKEKKILEELSELIQEQKNFHKNDLENFIASCHKKAMSSNIQSHNSFLSYYSKEVKKVQKYLNIEKEKNEVPEQVKGLMKKIQAGYNNVNKLIYGARKHANALKEKKDWENISKLYLTLIPAFYRDENLVFSEWKELEKELNIELKVLWKFQVNLEVKCLGCQVSYETNTILKHLTNSKYCYEKYNDVQLDHLKNNSRKLTDFKRTIYNKTELPRKRAEYYQNNKEKFKKWKKESDERHLQQQKKKQIDNLEYRKKQYQKRFKSYLDNEKAYYELHIQKNIEKMKSKVFGNDLYDQLTNIELQIQAKFEDFDRIFLDAKEKSSQVTCHHDAKRLDPKPYCGDCSGAVDYIYSFIGKETRPYPRISKFEDFFMNIFRIMKSIAKENKENELSKANPQLNFEKILKDGGRYKDPNEKLNEVEARNMISCQGNFSLNSISMFQINF